MKAFSAPEIRNVAILGHSGSGKTTISEAALFIAGVTSRIGKVDEGNTVSDYDQEEIKRKVSCSASMIPVEWQGKKINFIDTPGYFDFVGEVKEALYAADLALIIVSAKSGTAAMKLTANVLLVIAPLLLLFMAARIENFWGIIVNDNVANAIASTGAVLILFNYILLRRMSNFKP